MEILPRSCLRVRKIKPGWPLDEPNAPTLGPSETMIFRRVAPHNCLLSGYHGMTMKCRYAWPETALSLGPCPCGGRDPPRRGGVCRTHTKVLTVSCRPDELPSDQIGPARRSDRPRCADRRARGYPGSASWVGSPEKSPIAPLRRPEAGLAGDAPAEAALRAPGGAAAVHCRTASEVVPATPRSARGPRGRSEETSCALAQYFVLSARQDWKFLREILAGIIFCDRSIFA